MPVAIYSYINIIINHTVTVMQCQWNLVKCKVVVDAKITIIIGIIFKIKIIIDQTINNKIGNLIICSVDLVALIIVVEVIQILIIAQLLINRSAICVAAQATLLINVVISKTIVHSNCQTWSLFDQMKINRNKINKAYKIIQMLVIMCF